MKIDILAIGVHPDDVELSCSGTLLSHADQGYTFGLLDLTQGELGTRGTIQTRYDEAKNSASMMGAAFRKNLKLPDGQFLNNKESQTRIIEIIRWCKPQIVLSNAKSDRHPDHGRASKLIADACYYAGLRMWESTFEGQNQAAHRPAQHFHYIQDYYREPDFVVDISPYMEKKIACIKAFKTQFHDPKSKEPETPLTGIDFLPAIESRAREMGRPAGFKFAEGFEKTKRMGLVDLGVLK